MAYRRLEIVYEDTCIGKALCSLLSAERLFSDRNMDEIGLIGFISPGLQVFCIFSAYTEMER